MKTALRVFSVVLSLLSVPRPRTTRRVLRVLMNEMVYTEYPSSILVFAAHEKMARRYITYECLGRSTGP